MPHSPAPAGPDDPARLVHMRDAARQAMRYVRGRVRADLDSDDMVRRALVNAIQEIGEAAVRFSAEGRHRVPGVPWEQIVKMRNIIVHVYWGLDLDRVWQTAVGDLPPFADKVDASLSRWPAAPPGTADTEHSSTAG